MTAPWIDALIERLRRGEPVDAEHVRVALEAQRREIRRLDDLRQGIGWNP